MSAAATTLRAALGRNPSLPTFFDNLDSFAEAPEGVAKLRAFVLDLAVRGKLVEQDENDEPASELLERVAVERAEFAKANKLRAGKPLPAPDNDEVGFSLPPNWVATRLDDLSLQIHYGYTASANADLRDVRMLRITDIQDNTVNWESVPGCEIEPDDVAQYELRDDDLLIARTGGTIGKTYLVRGLSVRSVFASYLIRVIPSREVSAEYIKRFLESQFYWNQLYAKSAGTGQPNVNATSLKSLIVPLPPLSEQRRIVSKVDGLMSLCDELESRGSERVRLRERASRSCLDRLVVSRSRRDLSSAWQRLSDHFEVLYDTPETLAHLRQSILQLAVQGKLVPQDPNDEPACAIIERIQDQRTSLVKAKEVKKPKSLPPVAEDDVPYALPPGWEWARLGDVTDARFSISYGVLVPGPDVDDGVPFVRVQDLSVNHPTKRPNKTISRDVEAKYARTRLLGGEILLAVVGATIGKIGVAPSEWNGANIARAVCRIAPASELDRDYIVLVLLSDLVQDHYREVTRTLAQPTLNVADIKKTPIPLPPLAEQNRIVAQVDQLLSQCDESSARLRDRQSATQQLLTAIVHQLVAVSLEKPNAMVSP